MDAPTVARPGGSVSGYRDILRRRSFLPFLLSGALSFGAPSTLLVVLIWAVAAAYPANLPLHFAYSALALALLGLAATVPTLAAAVVSGAFADRFDRRRLMQATNLIALVATGGLVATLFAYPTSPVAAPGPPGFYLPLWILLAFPLYAIVMASATTFRPAFNATVPTLLPSADLGRANGLIYGVAVVVSVVGSLAATGVASVASTDLALLVPLALFAATGLALLGVAALPAASRARGTRFSAEVTEGYRFLWRHPALLQITVSALLINFLSALAFVELGLYVRDWLGVSEAIFLGAMVTGGTVGSGVGTLLAGRLRFEPRAGKYLIVLTAFQGLAIVALAFSRSVTLSVPLMFLFGLFPGLSSTIFLATIQATVPNEVLGRVLAADEVGSFAMVPVGQYAGGIVTVAAGIQATYLLVGAGTIGVAGAMASFRGLRSLGFEPKHDPGAPPPGGADPTAHRSPGFRGRSLGEPIDRAYPEPDR